jgi:hypothetical protein
MRLFFILLNLFSFCTFWLLGHWRHKELKKEVVNSTPIGRKRWPMRLVIVWVTYRIFNYVFLISLIGTYTDDFVVLGLTFLIYYHFLYLRYGYGGRFRDSVRAVRGLYSFFNVVRLSFFIGGFFVMGGFQMFAFPYTNINKEPDYNMLDDYWLNKSEGYNVLTHKGGVHITIIRVLKHSLFTKRVIFSRMYYFMSDYYGSGTYGDTVQYGRDSVYDEYSGTWIYKRDGNYYLTYLGDGSSMIGDGLSYIVGSEDSGYIIIKKTVDKKYLDSSNKALGQPVGVQDKLLN